MGTHVDNSQHRERSLEKIYYVRLSKGRYLKQGPLGTGFFSAALCDATPMSGVVARILASANRAAGGDGVAVLISQCQELD